LCCFFNSTPAVAKKALQSFVRQQRDNLKNRIPILCKNESTNCLETPDLVEAANKFDVFMHEKYGDDVLLFETERCFARHLIDFNDFMAASPSQQSTAPSSSTTGEPEPAISHDMNQDSIVHEESQNTNGLGISENATGRPANISKAGCSNVNPDDDGNEADEDDEEDDDDNDARSDQSAGQESSTTSRSVSPTDHYEDPTNDSSDE
jgi:hypothetical protein